MKIRTYTIIFLALPFFLINCKKDNKIAQKSNVDIYVVGSVLHGISQVAAYWKNGVLTQLIADTTSDSRAAAIAINGSDVYIAGYSHDGAILWKNNIASKLKSDKSIADVPYALSIAISNNEVYVGGGAATITGLLPTVYWKNDELTILPDSGSYGASGIAVVGNDVFLAGTSFKGSFVWKNNFKTLLYHAYYANCISSNGTDIYVGGSLTGNDSTVYWKNGVVTVVSTLRTLYGATGILLNGNDVYLTGTNYDNSSSAYVVPMYWKNGVAYNLSDGKTPATANGIAINGSDIYVAGGPYSSVTLQSGYWKNGVMVKLPKCFYAAGIAVVPK